MTYLEVSELDNDGANTVTDPLGAERTNEVLPEDAEPASCVVGVPASDVMGVGVGATEPAPLLFGGILLGED